MAFLAFKTLHFIGFTAWFAGLFYLVRMFVYHTEAYDSEEPDRTILKNRYALMESRVYTIICNPAMMITWTAGLAMIYLYGIEWLQLNYWILIKIFLVVLLTAYHLYCKRLIRKLKKRKTSFSSFQFRLFNEVPALFLIFIVILAVFKNMTNAGYAVLVVLFTGVLFYIFAMLYRKVRMRNEVEK